MTPHEIADLLRRAGSQLSPDDHDGGAPGPAEALQRRTELLLPALGACQQAWSSGSEEIDLIAEKLADGGRDVAWRGPLGGSGILDFFLRCLAVDGLRQRLRVHALRLVGNCCADADENCARVVQGNHLAAVIRHLQFEDLIPFAIPVLFNVLVDYEPAQLLASESSLSQRLTTLLSSPSLASFTVFVPHFCKILALLATQEGEAAAADPNTVNVLLSLATSPPYRDDLDDFVLLVSVAASYLAHETFQSDMIHETNMQLFVSAFYHAHTHFDQQQQISSPDSAEQLEKLLSSLLIALADVSGRDIFASHHPLQGQVAQTLLVWLQSANAQLQSAACLALGNLSRSDAVSIPLVQTHSVQVPLIKLLSSAAVTDPQLLHSALSFMKNLAVPIPNKPHLGGLLDPACLPRILSLDASPQVQFVAVSLTRLLLVNCPPNVERICAPLSTGPTSPARERSGLSNIISLFERSDSEPTRLEAARAIAALCRVLHSTSASPLLLPDWDPSLGQGDPKRSETDHHRGLSATRDNESEKRGAFYTKHIHLAKPLSYLITQQKWPTLRSEAWFVFALMCRSKDGARIISVVLQTHGSMPALIKAVTGRETLLSGELPPTNQPEELAAVPEAHPDGQITAMADSLSLSLRLQPKQTNPKQEENMARADRENALVMCTELLRTWGHRMPSSRLSVLQDLVKEGTEIVVAQRATALSSGEN